MIALQQHIYLQLDNNIYSAGDTVHFQGYVLQNGLPAVTSKNLYVDWFGDNDKLLAHQVYLVVNGTAAGQWAIPELYEGGSFKVLAYTSSLIQSDSSLAFHQEFPLLGHEIIQPFQLKVYPEGGMLIAGIINRVGYHIAGSPAMEMLLVSSNNDTVTKINTSGKEYGNFSFIPENNKSYHIALPVNGIEGIDLPLVQEKGIALQVTPYPNSIAVMLRRSKGLPVADWQLTGIMNGDVAYQSTFSLKNRDSGFIEIPTQNLPKGELLITVYNNKGQLQASRLVYIPGKETPGNVFTLTYNDSNSNSGQKSWRLNYRDSTMALLSVAVADAVLPECSSNMQGWLLLGKDVPDSLLHQKDPASLMATDNIMLCSSPLNTLKNINTTDTAYFCLSGKITGKKLPKEVSLIVKTGGRYQPVKLPLDEKGCFRDSSFLLFDSCYVALAKGQENLALELDTLSPPAFLQYPFSGKWKVEAVESESEPAAVTRQVTLPLNLAAYKDTSGSHHLLPTVEVKTQKWRTKGDSVRAIYMSDMMQNRYPNGYDVNFDGDPALYMGGATIWDLLLGKVPNYGYNPITKTGKADKVFLDEVEMSVEGVDDLQLPQIAFVKYIPGHGTSITSGKTGSILLIYSKKYKDPTLKERLAHNWGKAITGYNSYIPFGQTSFDTQKKDSVDRRKTLYWEPGVIMDANRRQLNLDFENNSLARQWRIVVEGIKVDGMPVYYEEVIK
ncbi:hypothetical protein [Parafilimonas sp.]|uniref:hypothetical protein n=1 Tax=Parafilimonas sp. TaxID=1969739 RepID=UPI0039E397AE